MGLNTVATNMNEHQRSAAAMLSMETVDMARHDGNGIKPATPAALA